MIIYKSNSY